MVKVLLKEGANIEDHNENGHTPLMEAASAGHVEVARVLLEYGAGINTHSNEFKESALTLACYKGQTSRIDSVLLNTFRMCFVNMLFTNALFSRKGLENGLFVFCRSPGYGAFSVGGWSRPGA